MRGDGEWVEIPIIRHRFRIAQNAAETGGESLRLEWCAPPHGCASEHVHPRQKASLQVVSGTLGFRVGRGPEQVLGNGRRAVGPAGVPHAWRNLGDGEVCFLVEFHPALNTEALVVAGGEIARDWGTNKLAVPKLLIRFAVLLREIGDPHLYLTRPPIAVQRWLLAVFARVLAPIGRLLGYKAAYP